MRFIKSIPFRLSVAYDYTDVIDITDVPEYAVIVIESETFYTPYIKLPFNGRITAIQRYQEYSHKNLKITLVGTNLQVYHDYPQAEQLTINVYVDDLYDYDSEMLPVVVHMRDIIGVYVNGKWLDVVASVSGYTVTLHYFGTDHGDNFYPIKIRTKDREYSTQNLKFTAIKNAQGQILSYDATSALFATQYV